MTARAAVLLLMSVAAVACGGDSAERGPEPFAYNSAAPLAVHEQGSWIDGDVRITSLTYASAKGGRVPALVIAPRVGNGPFAGLIVQHGAESNASSVLRDAEEFARLGAVAIAIDAPWARRPEGDITLTEQDRADQIQLVVDIRRAVDFLVMRDDVDPDRIGYVGFSYGGSMGGLVAGVEDRVATFVLSVGGGGLVSYMAYTPHTHVRDGPWPPEARRRWVDAMTPIEPIAWIGRAKAPIFFQFGRHDDQVRPADTNAFQRAARGPKRVKWYDAGHLLPSEAACDAARWLEQHLGIAGDDHSACP